MNLFHINYSHSNKIDSNENPKISTEKNITISSSNISTLQKSGSLSIAMPIFDKKQQSQNNLFNNNMNKNSNTTNHNDDDEKSSIIEKQSMRIDDDQSINNDEHKDWFSIFKSGLYPFGKKSWPVVAIYVLLVLMLLILSGEMLLSQETSNEFLELDPFNYMIGPSVQILIESGARFSPCMRPIESMPANESYVCLNSTLPSKITNPNNDSTTYLKPIPATNILHSVYDLSLNSTELPTCKLQDICGMSGFVNETKPDQNFRFFTPIFVHSGLIHYIIIALFHWYWAVDLERIMNPIRFSGNNDANNKKLMVYISSGVFGNIFGANFATATNPFMGCSTSFFGILGCYIIDILYMWPQINQPFKHLIKTIVFITFSFILGLLPGVDNFSHIGGLIGGLCIGLSAVPCTYYSTRYKCCIWFLRLIGLILYIGLTIVLLKLFYQGEGPDKYCPFCQYLSCIPIGGFCD
ncbi:unnamed protein product [Cunninghamella blakesleeana]